MIVHALRAVILSQLYVVKRAIIYLVWAGVGIIGMANVALSAQDPVTLIAGKGCMACHDINERKLGPAFKDVAKRYSIEDSAMLTDKVLNGSSGSWGRVPMPASRQLGVTESDARQIVDWILNDL